MFNCNLIVIWEGPFMSYLIRYTHTKMKHANKDAQNLTTTPSQPILSRTHKKMFCVEAPSSVFRQRREKRRGTEWPVDSQKVLREVLVSGRGAGS